MDRSIPGVRAAHRDMKGPQHAQDYWRLAISPRPLHLMIGGTASRRPASPDKPNAD
jgi:hypothetical protein